MDFENSTSSSYGAYNTERSISVTVFYFPSDRHQQKLEIMQVQARLERAFHKHLTIDEGFTAYIPEIESVKVDGVLQSGFEIYTLESDLLESGEFVEHLKLTLEEGD